MNNRLRILSFIVMTYMLAALCWWAVLLHRKNTDVFKLESQLLQERFINDAGIPTVDVTTLPEYEELKASFDRQMMMITGEALVFGLVLIMGIYFINRAFNRELAIAEKQKNFLLSITHELKSPLASISLILDTFIKRDLPKEKVQELSADALQESTRLNELFNKILLATRLGNTHQFHMQDTDISNLLSKTVEKFQRVYPNVKLEANIDENVVKSVDQDAMISVVNNLLENAIKYSTKSPEIRLSLRKQSEKVTLLIADNGIGIPTRERTNVFEQFYRIGSEDTRTSKGTGLGLYIAKEIITAHKGKIKVTDSPLGGSQFEIIF